MAKPNNYRCPRCKAKMKTNYGIVKCYTCNRCGYTKTQEPDNLTKEFMWGPLIKAKRTPPTLKKEFTMDAFELAGFEKEVCERLREIQAKTGCSSEALIVMVRRFGIE